MTSPHLLRAALAFYGAMAVCALVWGQLGHNATLLWWPGRTSWLLAAFGLLTGTMVGLLAVGLSRLMMRFRWAQQFGVWVASLLGPLSWSEAALLAGTSSVAEELLFRGAVQASWGIGIASLLFALAHFPVQWSLWPWTVSAGLMGLVFGAGTRLTGNLAFAITAHFVVNLLNLRYLSGLTPPDAPQQMSPPRCT